MNVINPLNTEHTLKIVPRYYTEASCLMELFNEDNKTTETFTVVPFNLDGYMYISFTKTFTDKSNYQIKIQEVNDVVYRGKLFITSQSNNTQDYKITKDVFTYE